MHTPKSPDLKVLLKCHPQLMSQAEPQDELQSREVGDQTTDLPIRGSPFYQLSHSPGCVNGYKDSFNPYRILGMFIFRG